MYRIRQHCAHACTDAVKSVSVPATVFLVYNPSSGPPIKSAGPDPKSKSKIKVVDSEAENILRVELPKGAGLKDLKDVVVESAGEPAELVKIVLQPARGAIQVIDAAPVHPTEMGAMLPSDAKVPREEFITAESYAGELADWMGKINDPPSLARTRRMQTFFSYLDLATLASLACTKGARRIVYDESRIVYKDKSARFESGVEDISAMVSQVMATLTQRVMHRPQCQHYITNVTRAECPLANSSGTSMFGVERAIINLFDAILAHFFTNDKGRVELGLIEEAFELFSNGELRLKLPSLAWACQPSSGFYYYFGEFALLAATNLPNSHWLEIARAMVRTQEIFASTYAPRSVHGRAGLDRFAPGNYDPNAANAWNIRKKHQLREHYDNGGLLELSRAAAKNLRSALPE
ncbi:MAG: hypothetical protein HY286_07825 [Planctomycetes bacterium]|nr:hypothetical protein [Planctomycetota bacterium]